MKRNGLFVLVLALAAVLCTGCGVKDEDLKSDPLVNADGTAPVGSTLVAPAPQDDSFCWTTRISSLQTVCITLRGSTAMPRPYENSDW